MRHAFLLSIALAWIGILGVLNAAKEKVTPPPKIIKKKLTPDFFKKSEEAKHSKTAKIGITDHRVLEVGQKITLSVEGLIPKHILIPEEQLDPEKEYTLYVGLLDFESFQVGINQGVKYGSSDLEMDYERKIDWVEKRYHFKLQPNSSASQEAFKRHKKASDPKSEADTEQEAQTPIFEKTIDLSQRILPEGMANQDIPSLSLTDWDFNAELPQGPASDSPSSSDEKSTSSTHRPRSGTGDKIASHTSSNTKTSSPTYQTLNLAFRRESPSRRGTLAFASPIKVVLELQETTSHTTTLLFGLSIVVLGFCAVVGFGLGWQRVKSVYLVLVG